MQNKNTKPSLRSCVPEFCSPFRKHLPYHAGLQNKIIFSLFFVASEGEREAGVPSSVSRALRPLRVCLCSPEKREKIKPALYTSWYVLFSQSGSCHNPGGGGTPVNFGEGCAAKVREP